MKKYLRLLPFLPAALLLFQACKTKPSGSSPTAADSSSGVVLLPEAEIVLFDGSSLNGWHIYNQGQKEIKNWTILDSTLVCLGEGDYSAGGDLVTDREFENFELSWEWKLGEGSNSGVMYHVIEDPKYKSPNETGPEYQIVDDIGSTDKLEELQKTGADNSMYRANSFKNLNPIGQWNRSKIIFNNGHVEHWLNNKKILEFEAWSRDWKDHKDGSKWKDFPGYGLAKKGKIALQNHGKRVYYRNIVVKEF